MAGFWRILRIATGVSLLVAAFLCLTYVPAPGWWVSPAGSALIVAAGRLAWPRTWRQWLGLSFDAGQARRAGLLLVLTLAGSLSLILPIAGSRGIIWRPFFAESRTWLRHFHTAGQTLNEEIVLGAVLLAALRPIFRGRPLLVLAVTVAAAFSALHRVFYRCVLPPNRGNLAAMTLGSLFLVGVIRNHLILRSGHIAYSWALHLGWNAVFFRGEFADADVRLNEPACFNLFLGSPISFCAIVVATAGFLYFDWRTRALTRRSAGKVERVKCRE